MITPMQICFLRAVLGSDGYEAIAKASARSPALVQALVPRTLLSWSALVGQYGYQGPIPGCPETFLEFRKSESNSLSYDGALTLGTDSIPFSEASVYRLAAHMAVALGIGDGIPSAELRGLDLARLGKSIDLLVRSRVVNEALRKATFTNPTTAEADKRKAMIAAIPGRTPGMAPGASIKAPAVKPPGPAAVRSPFTPAKPTTTFSMPSTAETEQRLSVIRGVPRSQTPAPGPALPGTQGDRPANIGKAELPGTSAKPIVQVGAQEPLAPTKQPKIKKPVKPKLPALKITKSEMLTRCQICRQPQFNGNEFTGCYCMKEFAKSVLVTPLATGAVLQFGGSWDMSAIEVLIESLHGGPQS